MKNENVRYIKQKTVYENETALFNLLTDHPVYSRRVKEARVVLKLPIQGYDTAQMAHDWEHSKKYDEDEIKKKATEIISGFNIPETYRFRVQLFTEDYLISERKVDNLLLQEFEDKNWKEELQDGLGRKIETVRIITASPNREWNKYLFEPNSLYFKVSPEVRYSDLRTIYQTIKGFKKDLHPFTIPKPQKIQQTIWRMRMEGMKPKQIITELKKDLLKTRKIDNHFIDINTQRYKKALETLMKLPK